MRCCGNPLRRCCSTCAGRRDYLQDSERHQGGRKLPSHATEQALWPGSLMLFCRSDALVLRASPCGFSQRLSDMWHGETVCRPTGHLQVRRSRKRSQTQRPQRRETRYEVISCGPPFQNDLCPDNGRPQTSRSAQKSANHVRGKYCKHLNYTDNVRALPKVPYSP